MKNNIELPKHGFYTTLTFMRIDLKLKGNDLSIFSITEVSPNGLF